MTRRDVRQAAGTVGLALAMACLPGAGSAQTEPGESFERFQLFTNCSPVTLSVSLLGDPDVFLRDLTDEAIGLSVRSRLRTTGLYAEDGTGPVLWIEVQVVGAGVSYRRRTLEARFRPAERRRIARRNMEEPVDGHARPGRALRAVHRGESPGRLPG